MLPPGTRRPQLSLAAGRLPPDPSPSLWGFPPEIFGFLPKFVWISILNFLSEGFGFLSDYFYLFLNFVGFLNEHFHISTFGIFILQNTLGYVPWLSA